MVDKNGRAIASRDNTIYCPMSFNSPDYIFKCKKDNCAWWYGDPGACAVWALARGIENLNKS